MPRVNMAWDIDGEGNNVLRGGYGMFDNRNMGNVEYDNALRIPPQRTTDQQRRGRRRQLHGNGQGPDLQHARPGDVRQTVSATSSINTLTPGLLHVPEDAQLQRVVRAPHLLQPGGGSGLRRHARARPREPRERQRRSQGALQSGTSGNADLANPVNRVALDTACHQPRCGRIQAYPEPHAVRLRGRVRLQLAAGDAEPPDRASACSTSWPTRLAARRARSVTSTATAIRSTAARTYGIRNEDRTHILNVSWNAFLPDGAKGKMDNAFGRGLLNGWQLSGISTFASGTPIWLGFSGPAGSARRQPGVLRHAGHCPRSPARARNGDGLAPIYTCDPRDRQQGAGEKLLDINCIGFPAFGPERAIVLRRTTSGRPSRTNHDLTLFKNFAIRRGAEAAVPRRVLQPVQPGVREHQRPRRLQPDSEHRLQPHR